MFWSIKVLVYLWAFSFFVVSNFWCLFTSPVGQFSNKFSPQKNICSCVCVPWTQHTMHISLVCNTLLSSLSKVHEEIPVQIFLDFLPPPWNVLFRWLETWKLLIVYLYQLTYLCNISALVLNREFYFFNRWFHTFHNIIYRNE